MRTKTDKYGQILAPHHDGELLGVMCLSNSEVEIMYRCTKGVQRVIRLLSVYEMDISCFRNGNIILSIMIHPAEEASERVSKAQLCRLGYGRPIPLKGKVLFLLDSSYGAEIIANCDDVLLESADDKPKET